MKTARRSLEEVDEIFLNEKFGMTHTRKPAPKRRQQSFTSMGATNDMVASEEKSAALETERAQL